MHVCPGTSVGSLLLISKYLLSSEKELSMRRSLHGCNACSFQWQKKSHLNCISSAFLLAACVRQKGRDNYVRASFGTFTWFRKAVSPPPRCQLDNSPETYLSAGPLLTVPYQTCIVFFFLLLCLFCLGIQYSAPACLLIDGKVGREHSSSVCKVWSHVAPSLPVVN